MFKFAVCGTNSAAKEKPVRVVVERREKTYTNKVGKVSRGWEIVREILVCAKEVQS